MLVINMNIFKQLNEAVRYIEANLENDVDYKKISQILCTNPYVMQRLFHLITNITVTEYIKKRRLSVAASAILKGEKVIDVAIKYQYGSSEAFSRAFKSMHGVNPSDLKDSDIKLNLMPVLTFDEENNSVLDINYRIIKNKGFKLFTHNFISTISDVSKHTNKFWEDIKKANPSFLKVDKRKGVVEYKDNEVCYHAGLEGNSINGSELIIPESNWLVLEMISKKAKDIDAYTRMAYEDYSKSIGISIIGTFDVEIYYNDFVELWFQISD